MASRTTLDDPPSPESVELSLFGPGYGESCLIHLGWNDWLIVDSCRDQRSRVNPVLQYLDRIGVNPAEAVKLVVASHAHDDHIAGLSEIVERCESSGFVCPVALTDDQFFALLEADEELSPVTRHSSYAEFRKITDILERRATSRSRWPAYQWAVADRPLYRRPRADDRLEARVTALSPSDEAVTRTLTHFASLVPFDGQQPRRIATTDPNTLTCALWVEIGDTRILLGGDLERGPGAGCGWNAVINSTFRPSQMASAFKVPHHGSANAHHTEVWEKMLTEKPLAIMTPWRRGKREIPTMSDRRRICDITDDAYITAGPKIPNQPAQVKRIAAQLSTTARNVQQMGMAGHIRARLIGGSSRWTVDLARQAQHLCALCVARILTRSRGS